MIGGIIATMTTNDSEEGVALGQKAVNAGYITETAGLDEALLKSYDGMVTYVDIFSSIGWVALASGVLLLLLVPTIRKWMHGVS